MGDDRSWQGVIDGVSPFAILRGDNLPRLKRLCDCSVDSIVTDPPAGIALMNRKWDRDHGGRDNFVAWMTERMAEAYRVLKPGGHMLVWAIPKTSHWTTFAIEDAGFEIVTKLYHHFGSAMPHCLNVSIGIDRVLGAEREVVGTKRGVGGENLNDIVNGREVRSTEDEGGRGCGAYGVGAKQVAVDVPVTKAGSPEAEEWEGWFSGVKPTTEEWILAKKPISERNISLNVLKWRTGALNVGATRVGRELIQTHAKKRGEGFAGLEGGYECGPSTHEGRFTPNLLFTHSTGCRYVGVDIGNLPDEEEIRGTMTENGHSGDDRMQNSKVKHQFSYVDHSDVFWTCAEDCPIHEIGEQSGVSQHKRSGGRKRSGVWDKNFSEHGSIDAPGDRGTAARYFPNFEWSEEDMAWPFLYIKKASRAEKEHGLDHLPNRTLNRVNSGGLENEPRFAPIERKNHHITVKPLALMEWLVKLVTPPGGVCLDFFCGSGTTGKACARNGFRFIGMEEDAEFCEIAEARIAVELTAPKPITVEEVRSVSESVSFSYPNERAAFLGMTGGASP